METIATNKYVNIMINKKPCLEHRHLMELNLNRKLLSNEVVHHINGIKNDNRIDNLQVMSIHEHASLKRKFKFKKAMKTTNKVTIKLLTTKEVATRLKVNPATINRWRKEEKPVPFLQVGRQVRFELDKVMEWLEIRKEGK